MPKGNPNAGDKKVNGILKVYDPVAKAYRPSYIAPDATATVQGDVLLSDSITSTDNAATGITAATPKAVKEVNDNANTKLSMTATTEQSVAGPVVFGDSLTVEGESTFNEKVTFDKGISIPGGVTLEGNVTGNADTATKLKTAVNINTKSGAQTASTQVSFDGSKDITLPLGDIDASAIKGVLSLDNIPQSAIERVVNYESLDAAFNDYLAAADDNKPFQSGDTIRIPDEEGDTAEMYAIVGDPAVKNNYVKYAASIAAEAVEAEHAQVADKINIADIADGSAMCVIDKVLKKSGATVGGEYKPMYLHNGTFKETTFTIKTNVPADAKFTDTTYTDFTPATEAEDGTIERGHAGLVPAPTTKDAKFLKNDGTWADVPSNWEELADKPLSYNGTIQDVGIENGKFYVEALFTSIGQVEFEAQLQVLSTAGNQLKLTSATYEPTADGTAAHKFIIEPPTGQVIADMKIVSAGLYYNSTTLLDEWKPEQIQGKYPGASGHIVYAENDTIHTSPQTVTVLTVVSGNNTQQFSVNLTIGSQTYSSNKQSFVSVEEGLYNMTFGVEIQHSVVGEKVSKIELIAHLAEGGSYTLDTWYPQSETLYINNGKIVEVTDVYNDSTKYSVEYFINTNYDYTKYHLNAKYDIPGWNNGGMSSPEFVVYDVRAGSKNVLHGSVSIPKAKTQDSGHSTLELVSIELYEQATTGNDTILDIWYPEKETGVSSWNDLTDKPFVIFGQIDRIQPSTDLSVSISVIPNTDQEYVYQLAVSDDSGHKFLYHNFEGYTGTKIKSGSYTFTAQEIETAGFNISNPKFIKAELYKAEKNEDNNLNNFVLLATNIWYNEDDTSSAEIINVRTIPSGTEGVSAGTVKYEMELTLTAGVQRKYPNYYIHSWTKDGRSVDFTLRSNEIQRGKTVKHILTETRQASINPENDIIVKANITTTAWNSQTGMEPVLAIWEKTSAEVEIDNRTIVEDYKTGKLKVNLLDLPNNPISFLSSTSSGIGLRYNNKYFTITQGDSSDISGWSNSAILDLKVDNKSLHASADEPLQVWTRPQVYGNSGLASQSTLWNSDTEAEETVNGLYINTGTGLTINANTNQIVPDYFTFPTIRLEDLTWGDVPNGRGVNYRIYANVPIDPEPIKAGVIVRITQQGTTPDEISFHQSRFYEGAYNQDTGCIELSGDMAAPSGFSSLVTNSDYSHTWGDGLYDSSKPIDIAVSFAVHEGDPAQDNYITFKGFSEQYLDIKDPKGSEPYHYFTADYSCYEMIDNLSATGGSISFKMMGWYEEFAGPYNVPVSLSIKKVDNTFLTRSIQVQTIDETTHQDSSIPHRKVFGTTQMNEQVWSISKTDWEAQSLTAAPSEYILVVATDKTGKELWAQKIDMPLTYLDPADAAQLVQDALATTTS